MVARKLVAGHPTFWRNSSSPLPVQWVLPEGTGGSPLRHVHIY